MAYLGGFVITAQAWEGPQSLRIILSSTYDDTYRYQLYVNRVLTAVTQSTTDRDLLATVFPALWPQEIQLVAVDPTDVGTDYGAQLPPRPYNQVKMQITPSGWTDARLLEITGGTTPGGAVDASNLLGRILFDLNREYDFITDPLAGSGAWNFKVAGVDETAPFGNRGTPATATVTILAHPPDVLYQPDGTRFATQLTGGNLVVNFTEAI
jgi:hypothetical protein